MSLLVPVSLPMGGPTFRSIGRTRWWPATNRYPRPTEIPLPSSRSISKLACSEYGVTRFLSTAVPPWVKSALTGNAPEVIRFSNAAVSKGGGTVPGGSAAPGGGVGQPARMQGKGRNMLFRSHVPVLWLLDVGNPAITGGRCGAGTKKKLRLYLS